ncbi:hypothetical protein ACWGII_18915 [Streptomyces sp. NPDC054855]
MTMRRERVAANVATIAPIAVGLGVGVAMVTMSGYKGAALWPVWSALALGLTGAAGIVFVLGVYQWRCLPMEERCSRRALMTIASLVGMGAVLDGLAAITVDDRPGAWRGSILVGAALIGATPTVCVSYSLWRVTRSDRDGMAAGEFTEWLLARRRSLRTLLAGLGALVALSTLALGAAVRTEAQMVKTDAMAAADAMPFEFVLIFGGAGSLLVAIVYVPAAWGLKRHARLLAVRLFTLTGTDEPEALLERAEQRSRFEHLLGAEPGPLADLQAGLVVLAPLLASAVTVWLPH